MLDVGCGWGSLAIHAAREYGVSVTGITLSEPQAALARKRAAEAGVGDRVDIRVTDYRELAGEPFDKIASIGMVEHVGSVQIDEYARTLAPAAAPGGQLLNHGIARLRVGEPEAGPFSERYVFPDAAPLHLSRIQTAIERAGLETEHVEGFRDDYAETLRHWARRLDEHRERGRAARRTRAPARLAALPARRPQQLHERLHVGVPGPLLQAPARLCAVVGILPAARQFACLGPATGGSGQQSPPESFAAHCRRKSLQCPSSPSPISAYPVRLPMRSKQRGIHTPFPIQELVIADVLAGRDVLAKSPTGSGKTLAFGVPMIDRIAPDARRPAALVLAPTRELASQIVDELRRSARARNLSRQRRLRRRRLREADARGAARPHPRRHPRPARGPAPAPRLHARARPHARPRRGRPHARHGLPARRRPHRRACAPPSARRCSSPPRSTARPAASPAPTRSDAKRHEHTPPSSAYGRHRAPLPGGRARRPPRRAGRRAARPSDRDRALVFVRTKRGADRLVRRLSSRGVRRRRDARRQDPAPAREGARLVRGGPRRHAGRHRRRRPRHRRQRHLARHQLRPAGRPRGLRPPHRAHRPRRADRRRHHVLRLRARSATSRRSPTSSG